MPGRPPIAELMDEHTALTDQAHHVRQDLGATGWEIVNQAHTRSPSFLLDQPTGASSPA